MKKILSIDPGLKNLSYCYIDSTPNVIKWDTICITENNCKKIKLEDIIECLLLTLTEHFDENFECDIILIENQPALINANMKTISVAIYTYFNMMKLQYGNIKEVHFIAATNKLKCKKGIDLSKETYKDRKKASIDLAKLYIEELFSDKLEWFNKLKKKDDAADTLNMSIYYMENILKLM